MTQDQSERPAIRFKEYNDAWKQRKLGELADIVGGGTPSTGVAKYWDGSIDWYAPAEIANQIFVDSSQRKITEEGLKNSSAKILPVGTILFTSRAGIGKTAILRKEGCTNQGFQSIVPYNDKLDPYFIFTRTEELKRYGEATGAGSTFVEVSGKQMANMPIMMPSTMYEQKRIGEIFASLDNLLTLHQRKYEQLKATKASLLDKMFPKEGEKVPRIRFVGFNEDWEQRKFSDLATMHARIGWQNLRTSEFLDSGDYLLVTGTDFIDGSINYDTCHYVEKTRYDQDKNIQIKDGSILVTKDGTLGKVAFVKDLPCLATLNAGVFNVEVKNSEKISNKYLYQYLKAPFLMNYVDQKSTGGTIKHLNQNILVDFPVMLPTKGEQEKIGELFIGLDNLLTLHHRKVEQLKALKSSLLHKMFV